MPSDFYHLHLHNEYSLLDSAIKQDDLLKYCLEKEIKAIAVTNHGNIDGAVSFYESFSKHKIKPIIGCEIHLVENVLVQNKEYHATVLVKNEEGWVNLCTMLSFANTRNGGDSKPRVEFAEFLSYLPGLIVLSGGIDSVLLDFPDMAGKIKGIIRNDFYLELMPHSYSTVSDEGEKKRIDLLSVLLKIHQEQKIPFVATNDVHYINAEDSDLYDVVRCIKDKKFWKNREKIVDGLFIRSRAEMEEAFDRNYPLPKDVVISALDNTIKVADSVSFNFPKFQISMPIPDKYKTKNENEDDVLIRLCADEGMKKRGLTEKLEYDKRLVEELIHIIPNESSKLNFTRYFLIAADLYSWAKSDSVGILCGLGRGSSCGSLVAYLLHITEVDPIKHDLLFERFIAPGRIDLPDIDMDFEDIRRDDVVEHLKEKYGENSVAAVSNFNRAKIKGILRDVARVFEVPLDNTSAVTKLIDDEMEDDEEQLIDFLVNNPVATKYYEVYQDVMVYAMKLLGILRAKSVHAAGIVVYDGDLRTSGRCVLEKRKVKINGKIKEKISVNWDKDDIEHFGLVKYDVLSLSTLTVLHEAKKMIKQNYGKDIDYYKLPTDDPDVYTMLSRGLCEGIFQIGGSEEFIKMTRTIQPKTFKDLVQVNALYRPGSLQLRREYIDRRKGRSSVQYIHPLLKNITEDTYGCLLYQEQIMGVFHLLAGLKWEMVDTLRKIMGKGYDPGKMLKYKDPFVEGCKKEGTLSASEAENVFEMLKKFGGYSFNKSHAVAYAYIGYFTAYVKHYYPKEFFCALLSYGTKPNDRAKAEAKKKAYLNEAVRMGITVGSVDINLSEKSWSIKDGILIPVLEEINGVGNSTADAIIAERNKNGDFKSLEEFLARVPKQQVNIAKIKAFALTSVFDSIAEKSEVQGYLKGKQKGQKKEQEG